MLSRFLIADCLLRFGLLDNRAISLLAAARASAATFF